MSRLILLLLIVACCGNQCRAQLDYLDAIVAADVPLITIPPGVYQVSHPIVFSRPKQAVMAYGVRIIESEYFTGDAMVIVQGNAKARVEVSIDGLEIIVSRRPIIGILSEYTKRFCLNRCRVSGSTSTGIAIRNAWDAKVIDCEVMECGDLEAGLPSMELSGALAHEGTHAIALRGVRIERFSGVALLAVHQKTMWIDACKFHGYPRKPRTKLGKENAFKSKLCAQFSSCDGVRVTNSLTTFSDHDFQITDCVDVEVSGTISNLGGIIPEIRE